MTRSIRGCAIAALLWASCLVTGVKAGGQPAFQMTPEEKQLLDLTNQARQNAKLPPLRPNATLFRVARAHSANMAKQGKMEHVLDGKDPFQRIREAGYPVGFGGENIAYGYPDVSQVMRVWMNSPPHRQNILSPNYTEIGLGRVTDAAGVPYYTQVFASPARFQP